MDIPTRDNSMMVRIALGQRLISRDTARAICKMVVGDLYGADECAAQEPLSVEDGGSVWNVHGHRVLKADATAADRGPLRMAISQFDGAIVSFTL